MKIEKLTDNKIRVFLGLEDLQQQHVDLHTFMSNSIESQKLFLDVLDQAEKEYGFVTKDYKIMLEAIVTSEFNFILTVTRLPYDNKMYNGKNIKYKRKLANTSCSTLIYSFSSFDDFCDFCINIKDFNFKKMAKKICLYFLDNKYYLVFNKLQADSSWINKMCSYISEFAEPVHYSDLFERRILEYGKIIMKNNAIDICNNFFNSTQKNS